MKTTFEFQRKLMSNRPVRHSAFAASASILALLLNVFPLAMPSISSVQAATTSFNSTNCPAWADGTTYVAGSCVSYNNRFYTAIVGHTASLSAGWTPEAATSLWQAQNIDTGTPVQDCLDWGDGFQYNLGQKTKYQDKSWIALQSHTAYLSAGWVPGQATSLWRVASEAEACPTFIPLPAHIPTVSRSYQYDSSNRLLVQSDTQGNARQFSYNANGQLVQFTDALGRKTGFSYDPLQRVTQVTDALNGQVKLDYNNNNQLIGVTDPENFTTRYEYNSQGDLVKQTSPDSGVTQFVVNVLGQPSSKTDARNKTAQYQYDALSRVTQIDYGNNLLHRFSYDTAVYGQGQLASFTDPNGSTNYSYDVNGRISQVSRISGSLQQNVGYQWQAGHLSNLSYPSGLAVQYSWQNGQLVAVNINGKPLLSNVKWTAVGEPVLWTWNNGQTWFAPHDSNGRLAAQYLAKSGRSYRYDANGNPVEIKDVLKAQRQQQYRYDALDRLSLGIVNDSSVNYYYDKNGNRTDQTVGTATTNYSHDPASNRLLSSTGANVNNYQYDANGSRTKDSDYTNTYDNAGRLIQSQKGTQISSYVYNALGQRIKKTSPDGITLFVYDESGHLLGEYDASGKVIQEIVWLNNQPIATVRPNGDVQNPNIYYIWADHLGTPREISNPQNKQIVWRWEGEAFGSSLADEDPSSTGQKFSFNLRFPGQYYDKETQRHYNYFRDYDPATGRYAQSDPIGLDGGINTYGYAGGNPISSIDPKGLSFLSCGKNEPYWGGVETPAPQFSPTGFGEMRATPNVKDGSFENQAARSVLDGLKEGTLQIVGAKALAGLGTIGSKLVGQETASIAEMLATHGKTMSNSQMDKLIKSLRSEGFNSPIVVTEHNGKLYVLDGNNRLLAAPRAGYTEVPIVRETLPYGYYKNPSDLMYTRGGY